MNRYRHILYLLAAVIAVQVLTAILGKQFYLTQLTMTAYYCIAIVGLTLLMGFAGQISLGHAGFFAIGGYTSAVLTTLDLSAYRDSAIIAVLAKLFLVTSRQDLYGHTVL